MSLFVWLFPANQSTQYSYISCFINDSGTALVICSTHWWSWLLCRLMRCCAVHLHGDVITALTVSKKSGNHQKLYWITIVEAGIMRTKVGQALTLWWLKVVGIRNMLAVMINIVAYFDNKHLKFPYLFGKIYFLKCDPVVVTEFFIFPWNNFVALIKTRKGGREWNKVTEMWQISVMQSHFTHMWQMTTAYSQYCSR